MSKVRYNLIRVFVVLGLVLGPSVAFARTATVDSGVVFYPTTYQNTTTTDTTQYSNTSNQNSNTSNANTTTTSTTTTDNRDVTYRNIYLTDGIADRFSSRYVEYSNGQNVSSQSGTDINAEYGRLAASAATGSDGFWPSGILQWIIVFILLIVIIALFRYVRGSKESYHGSPMKHA